MSIKTLKKSTIEHQLLFKESKQLDIFLAELSERKDQQPDPSNTVASLLKVAQYHPIMKVKKQFTK